MELRVPYRLKHLLDLVVQVKHSFDFEPASGYRGLMRGRPVQFVLATGGDYSDGPMASFDMLGSYLSVVFRFMGFEDIRTVTATHTAYPPEVSQPAIQQALQATLGAAASF